MKAVVESPIVLMVHQIVRPPVLLAANVPEMLETHFNPHAMRARK